MAARENHNENKDSPKRRKDAIQAARDYGMDVSMLADNLKRTPAERIRRHQIALNTAEKLRKARGL